MWILWLLWLGSLAFGFRKSDLGYFANYDSSILINSDFISEWTPVAGNISSGTVDYFTFEVNNTKNNDDYENLIFISGNLCNRPLNSKNSTLRVYYGFDKTNLIDNSSGKFVDFSNGYMSALAIAATGDNSSHSSLHLAVELVDSNGLTVIENDNDIETRESWEYRISVSENDLVYQWDKRSWLKLIDLDYNSALISVGDVLTTLGPFSHNVTDANISLYELYIYKQEDAQKFEQYYNSSLCLLKSGPYLVSSVDHPNVIPDTGVLGFTDLAVRKVILDKSVSGSNGTFYITGLNESTSYSAFLTKRIGNEGDISEVGGVLFSKLEFTTAADNTCSLVFGLDVCAGVAYSVPTPSELTGVNDKNETAKIYDAIAASLYSNFTKALQTIPCDTELDARYSPIRTCDNCASSYLNWLCSVTIPRCATTPENGYIARKKSTNRNTYIDELIKPVNDYYEVLPCIDMCHSIVRDCSSAFQFSCPLLTDDLLFQSYNQLDISKNYPTCNLIGDEIDAFLL